MVVSLAMGLSKHHKFSIIIDNSEKDAEETLPPFIAIQLGKEQIQTYAFIDSTADGNTITYELFQTYAFIDSIADGSTITYELCFKLTLATLKEHLACVS